MAKKSTDPKRKPASTAHLKKWPKGVSGNPLGAAHPNYFRFKEIANHVLAFQVDGEDLDGKKSRMSAKKKMAIEMVKMALAGDLAAMRELLDRTEGKATVDPDTQGDQPSSITVTIVDPKE